MIHDDKDIDDLRAELVSVKTNNPDWYTNIHVIRQMTVIHERLIGLEHEALMRSQTKKTVLDTSGNGLRQRFTKKSK